MGSQRVGQDRATSRHAWCFSHSGVSCSLRLRGLQPARLVCPWDSPGKDTGVGCHFLLHGILPTQELNPGLPHHRQIVYSLSYREAILRGSLLLSVTEHLSPKRTEVSLGSTRAPCGYQCELQTLTMFKSQFHYFLTVQCWINYLGLVFSSVTWGCYVLTRLF